MQCITCKSELNGIGFDGHCNGVCFRCMIHEYPGQRDKIERLQGNIMRLEHVVAVLKTAIGQAHLSAMHIEDHTRIRNGRLEVWCLGEWRDVEKADAEAGGESWNLSE